jgi:hypothetical protein
MTLLFRISVTFEMRTTLYGVHLFNDNLEVIARDFISKQKEGERALKRRDRERVCVRGRLLQQKDLVSVIKFGC